MSSLTIAEKTTLEKFLQMSKGYVLNFSDNTFGGFMYEAVDADIHSDRYKTNGGSKARKLREYWKIESDYKVGKLILAFIDYSAAHGLHISDEGPALIERSRQIAGRLMSGNPTLEDLKAHAKHFDANHLAEQIRRIEASIENDPALAIGTAKELIETVCKTILSERGAAISGTPDIPTLTKATLKELKLVPDDVPETAKGSDVIKRLLSNLGTIGNGLAELRGLYGTGHGKHGKTAGLKPRHARLAVSAASTLATFLLQTHIETKE